MQSVQQACHLSWTFGGVGGERKRDSCELLAELARTEEEKRTGLMERRRLGENAGMLFVYEREGIWAMWMKNTYIPLSVAFLARDGTILNIEDMEPLTEDTHQAAAPARYALEVNRGWFAKRGIGPGDRVEGLGKLPKH